MSRATVLARARHAAEAGMVDACTIRRPAGETTDDYGNTTPAYTSVYTGRCRIQQRATLAEEENVGQARQLMVRAEIQLPMTVTGLEPEDEVTITASVSDPDLPGRVFVVRDLAHGTDKSARRVGVVERTV